MLLHTAKPDRPISLRRDSLRAMWRNLFRRWTTRATATRVPNGRTAGLGEEDAALGGASGTGRGTFSPTGSYWNGERRDMSTVDPGLPMTLRDWCFYRGSVCGKVYGDPARPDGREIHTSWVRYTYFGEDGSRRVRTRTHKYILDGDPVDRSQIKIFKDYLRKESK